LIAFAPMRESGRANEAISVLIAASRGIRSRLVTVEIGATAAERVLRVAGVAARAGPLGVALVGSKPIS